MHIPAYKNPELPVDERVQDLLGRMTLEEKARQLDMFSGSKLIDRTCNSPISHHTAARDSHLSLTDMEQQIGELGAGAIHDLYPFPELANEFQRYAMEHTRLQIPFMLIEEGLHGFCKLGSTIFPGPLSHAASFDRLLTQETGRAIATEFRACGVHKTLGPTMDLVREPRWGRVEESYGEDVYLSAEMARNMVLGLQGDGIDHPDTVVAEPKHFAAHGIPEGGVNCAPVHMGLRELFTQVLPIFEAAIKEAGAYNVMCSYNSVDGAPCVSSKGLLTHVLRERFGMRGFVLTDLGAMNRLEYNHHTADSAEEAILKSVEAGVDMQFYDYPHEVHLQALIHGVRSGKLSQEILDTAVARVLRVKFELGLFENPYVDPSLYEQVTRCDRHVAMAAQVARESMCLLKNNGVLPLKKDLAKLAVIGPHVRNNYFGSYTPIDESTVKLTALDGIQAMVSPGTEILYDAALDTSTPAILPLPDGWYSDKQGRPGLDVFYYSTFDMTGAPIAVGHDTNINTQFIATVPHPSLPSHKYGVRWEGYLTADTDFYGELTFAGNESVSVFLNDENVMYCMGGRRNNSRYFHVNLKAGVPQKLRVDLVKDTDGSDIALVFKQDPQDIFEQAAEFVKDADCILAFMGDIPGTCGEGHDRSELILPQQQRDLLKVLKGTGKPLVLVLQNGRPLDLSWEASHVDAILEAFCPGEMGGLAIAETLFGENNPAGRLPVSFPYTVGSLPCYYTTLRGRSGRYLESIPRALYPFGHGLSYTEFAYDHLEIIPLNDNCSQMRITVDVTNVGACDGDEIVQLYLRDAVASVAKPDIELKGFERIHLARGETATVSFILDEQALKTLDPQYRFVAEAGLYTVLVGASSTDIRLQGDFSVQEDVLLEELDVRQYL